MPKGGSKSRGGVSGAEPEGQEKGAPRNTATLMNLYCLSTIPFGTETVLNNRIIDEEGLKHSHS